MENTCPLCQKQFGEKDHTRKSLRTLIELRGTKAPFDGKGPDVHGTCFEQGGLRLRDLINNLRQQKAEQPASSNVVVAPA